MSAFPVEGSPAFPRTGLLLFNHGARTLLNESIEGPSGVWSSDCRLSLWRLQKLGRLNVQRPPPATKRGSKRLGSGRWRAHRTLWLARCAKKPVVVRGRRWRQWRELRSFPRRLV